MATINLTRPTIRMTETDHDRLSFLVDGLHAPSPGAALLEEELERATVVGSRYRGPAFVRLNSIVEYQDLDSGQVRRLRIVLPKDARIEDDSISVLSPAGAALLGLAAGQTIHWKVADGRTRTLKVLSVVDGPDLQQGLA
jgi:regulator of nucleoside diphosphate kinase